MDRRAKSDLFLLTEEKFDFDLSLSPASSNGDEDEDEVFIGPVSLREKCVSVNRKSHLEDSRSCAKISWSPLTGDQLDAVCQEAHKLATELQGSDSSRLQGEDGETINTTSETSTHREDFVQDSEAKLDMFGKVPNGLSPIKRETFCIQDSPMKQLPPAIQRRLLRGSNATLAPPNSRAATNKAPTSRQSSTTSVSSSTRPSTRLSTSSPVVGAKVQPRTGLRGRASIGVGVVLPSKPAAPPASSSISKTKLEKTKLQPPSKPMAGRRHSPTSRSSSRAESYEDLLSDSASVASDISDSSLNSSVVGKRTLAPLTKNVVRNLSTVKAAPTQNRKVTDRRNTSSSSSSVSSFNSSLSQSPSKGKVNSSVNRSLSSSTSTAAGSNNRTVGNGRTRRSISQATAPPLSSNLGRRSLSTQARKLSEAEGLKALKSTPLKKAEAAPHHLTPAQRGLERSLSIPPTATVRPQSGLKAKPKPEALVVPTPSGAVRGVSHLDSSSKILKPKRLVSVNSMESLPQKPSTGLLTPSAGGGRSLQMKPRRPSALPTPVRHRASAIVTPTPKNQNCPARPPPTSDDNPVFSSIRKESLCSSINMADKQEEPVDSPEIQPFSLEEEEEKEIEEPPADPPSSLPESTQPEDVKCEESNQDQVEPEKSPIKPETVEEGNSKAQEVLLLDLPAPAPQAHEKLLIDLTNTPDLIRTNNKHCTTSQLIDLSSPLIKWSPEDKRENAAPLINLSF